MYNKTSLTVDTCICGPEGSGPGWEKGLRWQETFAVECHGCVPLQLSSSRYMSIRPTCGKFRYCTPFEVPQEPVTGKSVFVCCMPEEGSSGEETQVKFFRVRLDAKRPIGGHEEHMRVVISIHPAIRLQNALPYQIQTGIYSVPEGQAGVKVAECTIAEGSTELLYCADLSMALRLTAFLSAFGLSKVSKPVLVHEPKGSGLDKTIDLLDESGGVLRLGNHIPCTLHPTPYTLNNTP